MSETTPCDEIDAVSWESLPRTIRVNDFCKHCGFQCDHGKSLIHAHKKMLRYQGFKP